MNAIQQSADMNLPDTRVVAVDDLCVSFARESATFDAVRHLSFHVDRGETLAIVGESGSGKSVTSLALMRLVEHGGGRIASGRIALRRRNGEQLDLARASASTMRAVRGSDIAMIFQEPMTSIRSWSGADGSVARYAAIAVDKRARRRPISSVAGRRLRGNLTVHFT